MIGRGLGAVFLLVISQDADWAGGRTATKAEFAAFEKAQLEGRSFPAADPAVVHSLNVPIRGGRELGLRVLLPDGYDAKRPLPLLLAMGGGPLATPELARDQARQMAANWGGLLKKKDWILAVIEDTVSIVQPAPDLRFEALRPEDFRAAVDAVQARFNVHPHRVHATGVSLGANYAIHFAAHHPDWFAGIVPASSEGESREAVLRNLGSLSVYALNGARDRNIRTIEGPRRMAEILKKLGLRCAYEESETGGHDSFRDRYDDVLAWLEPAARNPWPKLVTRVPHDGLFSPARRRYWIEADSDQALFRAEAKEQTIEVSAACCRKLRIFLHDAIVDLDQPLTVVVNGRPAFSGRVTRTITTTKDRGIVIGATIEVAVPLDEEAREAAHRWTSTLAPTVPDAKRAWWEFYARATLAERRHLPIWEGERIPVLRDFAGYRLTSVEEESPEGKAGLKAGDVVTGFEDELFYPDGEGLSLVARTLLRRPTPPDAYRLEVLREGKRISLQVSLR